MAESHWLSKEAVPAELGDSLVVLPGLTIRTVLMGLSHCSPRLTEAPALPQQLRFQCYLRLTKDAEKPWPGISSDWKRAVNVFPDVTMGLGATSPQLVANRVSLVSEVPSQTWWGQKHDLMLTVFTCQYFNRFRLAYNCIQFYRKRKTIRLMQIWSIFFWECF